MAHSNHYYRQVIEPDNRHIDLLSRHETDKQGNDINCIQMVVQGPIYGTGTRGEVGIWLTEQQQDELIAGILERRGVYYDKELMHGYKGRKPIDPYGQQRSSIHPAKPTES